MVENVCQAQVTGDVRPRKLLYCGVVLSNSGCSTLRMENDVDIDIDIDIPVDLATCT